MFCYSLSRTALFTMLLVVFCLPVLNVHSQPDLDAPHDTGFGSGCLTCHDMAAYDQPALIPVNAHIPLYLDDSLYNNVCWSCHDGVTAPAVLTHSSLQTDNGYGNWSVDCTVCHNQHNQEQDRTYGAAYGKFIRTRIDLSKIRGLAKNGIKEVKLTTETGLNSFADGDANRNGICEVCHTQTIHFRNDGSLPDEGSHAGYTGTNCMNCHGHGDGFLGGHGQTHFRWNGGCENCHGAGDASEAVVAGIHANDCDLCHTAGGPYTADTNKVGDNGVGDATLAEGDAGTWTSSCVSCHNQAQVPGFHGMTLAEVLPVHDNLGSSRGSWADSGGIIPSTRAAGYSGKIDTANALIDDDYNCADCHDTERISFTPLEALEVHLFESGRGNGDCTTCHRASMVADEINSGVAGTTIECEDCHSLANGNGPSGEKMYQYDGVRHHKTLHAQAGNCTQCHADPRPADLSAESGYAGTAAVNDGSDGDGITWNDGFDDDFNINYTHPGGIPTQMGCRLCHTNYEEYKVDVKASGDGNWTTDEDVDVHGYNINGTDSGLTIYANDFDARGTSLTYLGHDDRDEIQGAKKTTQVSIPSHRIDAIDGSKIKVYNYGACFACHTVQIRHAAPIPAADYDISDIHDVNTWPYDTLRYAPGRSVFNDLKGIGPDPYPAEDGDAWDNHTKDRNGIGWAKDPNSRAKWVFRPQSTVSPGTDFFDDINNYSPTSLAAIPVNVNVNNPESLPGMTGPYTIRNFDTGPAAPVIDGITITDAQWTGSAVIVKATSSFGAGQSFSFTYTGDGGPCNTTMTWVTDHYEGICMAASGYTVTDTVTVYNNTTAAPDKKTSSLIDLTSTPVTPILASITLSDNNSADPAPAEAGYTNSHSVAVTLVTSNYPTHVMLSEESDFSSNSGWVLFDATVNYTLEDLGPPPSGEGIRTIYARVKNDAGESGSRNDSIILDTVSPTIVTGTLSDTLISPNGNETWSVLVSYPVTWNSGDITDSPLENLKDNPVRFGYSADNGNTYTWGGFQANDGLFDWIPQMSDISKQGLIKIRACDRAGNVAEDVSDASFWVGNFVINTLGNNNPGSLRYALNNVVDNSPVWFNIPDTDPGFINGVAVIDVATNLPSINNNGIRIEGDTQTTLQGDDNPSGPEIRINKAGTSTRGLTVTGDSAYISDLQITGFTTGVSSTGYDTILEFNYFGFSSDTSGFASVPNTTNAALSGQDAYPNNNYFACANIGLNMSGASGFSVVDYNTFGLFPDDTSCPNTNAIYAASNAQGIYINGNIISGSTTGISLGGTAANTNISSNTISSVAGGTGIYIGEDSNITTISRNIISGGQYGIDLDGSSNNTTITGNQIGVEYRTRGIHGGVNNVALLEDSGESWTVDEFVGDIIINNTDGSQGTITSNSANTITAVLTGGTENDWDTDDTYSIWIDLPDPSHRGIWVETSGAVNTIGGSPRATSDNALGNSNVIDPGAYGIYHTTDDAVVYGNFIGTNPEQGGVFAGFTGIRIESGGGDTIIGGGGAGEAGNVIANMTSYGVYHGGSANNVRISRNLIYNNGSDATDSDDGIDGAPATVLLTRPTISGLTTTSAIVSGVTSGSTVEVYRSDYDGTGNRRYGEGKEFIGSAVASGTSVTVDLSGAGLTSTDWVSAIWFNSGGNTSRFSANVKLPGPAVPTLDWTGETNYTTDGVELNSAISGSDFTFRVKYTDADNDAPKPMEVWIDEDDSNSYEADEKFAMTVAGDAAAIYQDGNYANGEIYSFTRNIVLRAGATIDYRFYASDSLSDAVDGPVAGDPTDGPPPGANTFEILVCGGRPVVDPNGTYFEAENFTSTIVQGSRTFSVDTIRPGYNGVGHLSTSGSPSYVTPPTEEGKVYELDFPTAGTYKVWIRGYNWSTYSAADSVFVGLDGIWTSEIKTITQNVWEWGNKADDGTSITFTIAPGNEGYHTFNIWFREWYDLDSIYLIKVTGSEPDPTDVTVPSGATVIDPTLCLEFGTTITGTATASATSTTSIDVSMPYTYDYDNDNTYTVDYKCTDSTSGAWENWVTNASHTVSPYTTAITGRTPGEICDVRMTYNDATGVHGTNPQTVFSVLLLKDTTTVGTATASMASPTSIDVSMPYTDDFDGDNTYTVDYKLSSLPDIPANWTNLVTNATHTASPYTNTITGLISSESYDIRLTYNDADGINGTNPQTIIGIYLDYVVRNVNDTGAGSLRHKLTTLIAEGGNNSITFNIPVGLLTNGVAVINTATDLPAISADNITIDGSSQAINAGDTNSYGPEVLLDGPGEGTSSTGFNITADSVIIKGLQIGEFGTCILTTGDDTRILGNYFGYSVDNTPTYTTKQNYTNITLSGTNAIVGSSNPADRNYITNASGYGVYINAATGTQLINNIIGLRSDNTLATNVVRGVYNYDSSDGLVQDNVFIGSSQGIFIAGSDADLSTDNVIKGNTFGVYYDAGTWTSVGGQSSCIYISKGNKTTIGGPSVATDDANLNDSNVFDPNSYAIFLYDRVDYDDTVILGNFIGTNPGLDETFSGDTGIYNSYSTGMSIGVEHKAGIHDGGDNVAMLVDSGAGWAVNGYVGETIYNTTDGSSGIITANTDNTITATLSGGTDNDWDTGDAYSLSIEAGNVITNMTSFGVRLSYFEARYVEIRQNSFYNNGNNSGDDAIFLGSNSNSSITRPVIDSASTSTVTVSGVYGGDGADLAGDIVEVYIADFTGTEYGEGKTFVGSAVVSFGSTTVSVPVSGVSSGDWVTVTRTNHNTAVPWYQTSAFSTNVQVP